MKRLRLVIIFLVLLLSVVVVMQLTRPKEPSYNGKTLTQWLADCHRYSHSSTPALPCEYAVMQIGSNAVPTLLRYVMAEDSKAKVWLCQLLSKQHLIQVRVLRASDKRQYANEGFFMLGKQAK